MCSKERVQYSVLTKHEATLQPVLLMLAAALMLARLTTATLSPAAETKDLWGQSRCQRS